MFALIFFPQADLVVSLSNILTGPHDTTLTRSRDPCRKLFSNRKKKGSLPNPTTLAASRSNYNLTKKNSKKNVRSS